jgi:hypothetical protein
LQTRAAISTRTYEGLQGHIQNTRKYQIKKKKRRGIGKGFKKKKEEEKKKKERKKE